MDTQWDYSGLAEAYLKRPAYSREAILSMLKCASVKEGDKVCDIGAGTAHLTLMLADHRLNITAIEPNDDMRGMGMKLTSAKSNVKWIEAVAEDTLQEESFFNLVTFGSSFNVTDQERALVEAHRILLPNSYFACMWNHRELDDDFQSQIECIIKSRIKGYSYGNRREDQAAIISRSNLFADVEKIEGSFLFDQDKEDCVIAWRSHNTLKRQAGDNFDNIIREIEKLVEDHPGDSIPVPYVTRIWTARVLK